MAVDLSGRVFPVVPGMRIVIWCGRRGHHLRIAGLPRWKRAVFTACRAGFERILIVTDGSPEALAEELRHDRRLRGRRWSVVPAEPDWAAALDDHEGRWVVLWDEWIVDAGWLGRLTETEGVPVSASTFGPFAADAPDLRRWAASGWQPSHPPTDALDSTLPRPEVYVRVVTGADVPVAEARLFQSLIPERDSFVTRNLSRRMSFALTRRLTGRRVRPNVVTLVSVAIGVAGGLSLLDPSWFMGVVGTSLFLLSTIVDGCDGELARLEFEESAGGARLDFFGDNVVHVVLFGSMALRCHWLEPEGPFLWLALSSVLGLAAVIGAIWWTVLRKPPAPAVDRFYHVFSNREFAYLLPLLALADRIDWFVWAVAVGVWVFPGILLALSWQSQHSASDAPEAAC